MNELKVSSLMAHPSSSNGDDVTQLTMSAASACGGCRFGDTLAYGDVLGIRAIYPTSAPFPTLYDP